MDITITSSDEESLEKRRALVWSLQTRQFLVYLYLCLVFGIGLLAYGFITRNNYEGGNYFYWSPVTAGIVFLYIAYFIYRHYSRMKTAALRIRKHELERANRIGDHQRIFSINADYLSVKNFEEFHEYKWSVFSHYKVHKEFLVLYFDPDLISPVVLELVKMTESEKAELMLFLKERLHESHDKLFSR